MIQNFVNKNVNDWDVFIGILMSAYRSMIHPATGFTPNMMMLGREVILPNHIIFPFPEQSMFTNNNYVEKLQSQLEEIYHLARENLRASAQRQKKDYDTRVSQNQYNKGSLVYRLNQFCKKLTDKWLGPFVITEIFMMSDYICNWDNCKFEGTKNLAIRHVIITHAPPEEVPYFCTLCSFRATNLKAFERHLTTFRQHILLEKENSQTKEYLQISTESYNVTWGN
ncbi:unnamed protein product [Mytilus coruscus]|uniref:C2H2-type domain-containing protein n=1 Tax=Mytilus coruscus TaxID=42192 RepID=A0A6J8AWJ5_MYTCO|nr:unnamed protein product [Mytilus coruscus]